MAFQKIPRVRHTISGFSLFEIMVVVVLLIILAAIIVPRVINPSDETRIVKAKQDITALQEAMDLYKLDNGNYPSTDQGLSALIVMPTTQPRPLNWRIGGYLPRIPIDPWGRPYQYLNPGVHNRNGVDIFSFASDGFPGPTGRSKIIGNWNIEGTQPMTKSK